MIRDDNANEIIDTITLNLHAGAEPKSDLEIMVSRLSKQKDMESYKNARNNIIRYIQSFYA